MRCFLLSVLVVVISACSSSADGLASDASNSASIVVPDAQTDASVLTSTEEVQAFATVWVTTSPIPAGMPVDEVIEHIEQREVDAAIVPDNAHSDLGISLGTVANVEIAAGTILTFDHLVTHYCFNDSRTCDVYMPPETQPGNVMAYVVVETIAAGTPIELGSPSLAYQELPAESVPIEAIFNNFETNGLVVAADLEVEAFVTLADLVTPECFSDPTACPSG